MAVLGAAAQAAAAQPPAGLPQVRRAGWLHEAALG